MDWLQVLFIILGNVGILIPFLLYIMSKIDKIREDMHTESKDFHGRLISLEERYLKDRKGKA